MTARIDGNPDQTSSSRRGAGGSVPSGSEPDRPRSADAAKAANPADRGGPDRRRPGDGLALGAPLTAAFIGGFLVIENLAGAEQSDDGGAAATPEGARLAEGESGEGADASTFGNASSGTAGSTAGGSAGAGDPAAAPSEDGALDVGGDGIGAAPGAPTIAAAAAGAPLPGGPEGGGSEANLNFFNINVGNGEAEAEVEPFVEDEIISRDRQVGTPGDDILVGTDGDDAISGAEGDDIIRGEGGSDILNGNGGDDQLFGGTGRDYLNGGAGDDRLDGGDDSDLDILRGGSGDDVLIVGGQHDVALESYGDAHNGGADLLIVKDSLAADLPSGADGFTFSFAENFGVDLPEGTAGARRLVGDNIEHIQLEGSANHDIVADGYDNRLTGNDGSNVIHAGDGNDIVSAGGGRDELKGGDGDDELIGGAGDDVIEGGLGRDMLYGEAGDDIFVIGLNDSAIDTIFDHEGANRLTLEGVTDQKVEASLLGDDLYITVDQAPVALVSGYVGHENALAGVDFGQGLKAIDTLLVDHADLEGAVDETERQAAEAAGDDLLAAHLHIAEPTHRGDPRADQRLDGSEGDDWLSGFDGRDRLFGHEGNDILEGGDGKDLLAGGAGDDRYLFSKGESGIDSIRDTEGRNLAELKGYDSADIEGAMLGDDLAVLADGKVLFTVDDFATNSEAFQGVQAGNRFIQTDDLLA